MNVQTSPSTSVKSRSSLWSYCLQYLIVIAVLTFGVLSCVCNMTDRSGLGTFFLVMTFITSMLYKHVYEWLHNGRSSQISVPTAAGTF
jgi:hypothetical protein